MVFTLVGRIVEQKVRLLFEVPKGSQSQLFDALMTLLEKQAVCIILGTGDKGYEQLLAPAAEKHPHVVYLPGYSSAAADAIYSGGDCFLMPSLFEPCGISQMLAMRAGQPCLVHHIGGLRDTVRDGINGFSFPGPGLQLAEQATHMLETCRRVLEIYCRNPQLWKDIVENASAERFTWEKSVDRYITELYYREDRTGETP
jgi:starch synthase